MRKRRREYYRTPYDRTCGPVLVRVPPNDLKLQYRGHFELRCQEIAYRSLGHQARQSPAEAMGHLLTSDIWHHASNVLVVDNGPAGQLLDHARRGYGEQQKNVHVLDPVLRCIYDYMQREEVMQELSERRFRALPFSRLPRFDLMVSSCDAYSEAGHVYTWSRAPREAYKSLRDCQRIIGRTQRVVVSTNLDCTTTPYCDDCMMRAQWAALPTGMLRFSWPEELAAAGRKTAEPQPERGPHEYEIVPAEADRMDLLDCAPNDAP